MSGMIAGATAVAAGVGGLGNAWSNKKATEAQERESRKARQATEAAAEQARADVSALFPSAQSAARIGYQGAMDILKGTMPMQSGVFQQGNVGAQQAILAGLPQIQNAILGNQVDYSAFQPQTLNFDTSAFLAGIPNVNAQLGKNITPSPNIGTNPTSNDMAGLGMFAVQQILSNPQYLNAARGLVK